MKLLPLVTLLAAAATQTTQDLCNKCTCKGVNAPVFTIDCQNRHLDQIPGPWPNTTTTIRATFAGNRIATLGSFPETDATLEIVLSNCQVRYLQPGLFVKAKNTKFLDLSHNLLTYEEISGEKFRGPGNDSWYEPVGLEILDLSYNQIHSFGKNDFQHLTSLKILNLEGNDFTVLDISTQLALSSIKTLKTLNLANNELTELVRNAIDNLNLTEINLAKNSLDFVPESLSILGRTLEVLTVDDNPIIEVTENTFMGLSNLRELSMNNLSKLKYINASTFLPTPRLKKLSLSNNPLLREIEREAFAPDEVLEELHLNNNRLFRIDFKLLKWSKLRVFEFKENPLSCSCDLHNITKSLSADITRTEDGPYCTDPRTDRPVQVFYLKTDICSYKGKHGKHREFMDHHFSLIKLTLIGLSVILMMIALVAAVLAYVRYRRIQRNLNYPFASEVLYNPLSTSTSAKY